MERCKYHIEQLLEKFGKKKKEWVDKDFPYEDIKLKDDKVVLWKRPHEFIDKPELFPPEISPNDVIQGALNDCYFLSAVSSLAEKPYRIDELFVTKEYNPAGFYVCKLNFNGVHQEVIVDDLFPVTPDTPHRPLYAQPASGKYIWVMVLEKCWAKLLKGYKNTNCTVYYMQMVTLTKHSSASQELLLCHTS